MKPGSIARKAERNCGINCQREDKIGCWSFKRVLETMVSAIIERYYTIQISPVSWSPRSPDGTAWKIPWYWNTFGKSQFERLKVKTPSRQVVVEVSKFEQQLQWSVLAMREAFKGGENEHRWQTQTQISTLSDQQYNGHVIVNHGSIDSGLSVHFSIPLLLGWFKNCISLTFTWFQVVPRLVHRFQNSFFCMTLPSAVRKISPWLLIL